MVEELGSNKEGGVRAGGWVRGIRFWKDNGEISVYCGCVVGREGGSLEGCRGSVAHFSAEGCKLVGCGVDPSGDDVDP